MLSIFVIAAARSDPVEKADGSLNVVAPPAGAPTAPPATGVGVCGTVLVVGAFATGPGAGGGAAGVEVIAGAGVEGGFSADEDPALDEAGAVLG